VVTNGFKGHFILGPVKIGLYQIKKKKNGLYMHERKVEDPEFYRNLYGLREKGRKVNPCEEVRLVI
jgi:hypothetical protein